MRSSVAAGRLAVLVALGCGAPWPEPAPVPEEQLLREHGEWRSDRREGLVRPLAGTVLWIGLWELPEGTTPFGSDPALDVVLPAADSPALAGVLIRSGQQVRLEPAPGSPIRIREGKAVTEPMALENDRAEERTTLALGSLGLRVHAERGTDRLWLRAWDEDSPKRETFAMPEYFPVSGNWRFSARLDAYEEPRVMALADVTDGTVENESPGELVFRAGGQEHRLIAFAGATSATYFVMIWDSTATGATYPGGRYMRVPLVDEDGWTTVDFNRAYNPPCVFTPYSVCALPPRENRLTFAVTAGEKLPATPAY